MKDEGKIVESHQKVCNDKLTWRNKELAEAAAAYAGWQYGGQNLRAYQCLHCQKWHLGRHTQD